MCNEFVSLMLYLFFVIDTSFDWNQLEALHVDVKLNHALIGFLINLML